MKTYSKTILYVDDDADDIVMLRNTIGTLDTGHQIVTAPDGVHALALLKQMYHDDRLPCLIVLDINMPRMDGRQTLVSLQKDTALSSIPVVLFSTSSSSLDKSFCKAKKVELITKPYRFQELYSTANKLLSLCKA